MPCQTAMQPGTENKSIFQLRGAHPGSGETLPTFLRSLGQRYFNVRAGHLGEIPLVW
jgi:hypothetical protein